MWVVENQNPRHDWNVMSTEERGKQRLPTYTGTEQWVKPEQLALLWKRGKGESVIHNCSSAPLFLKSQKTASAAYGWQQLINVNGKLPLKPATLVRELGMYEVFGVSGHQEHDIWCFKWNDPEVSTMQIDYFLHLPSVSCFCPSIPWVFLLC